MAQPRDHVYVAGSVLCRDNPGHWPAGLRPKGGINAAIAIESHDAADRSSVIDEIDRTTDADRHGRIDPAGAIAHGGQVVNGAFPRIAAEILIETGSSDGKPRVQCSV